MFPAHRYIVGQKSSFLASLFDSKETPIQLVDVDPLIFQQILIYIYTGSCDLLNIGQCSEPLKKLAKPVKEEERQKITNHMIVDENMSAFEYYSKNIKNETKKKSSPCDPVRLLQETAKKFGLKNLCKKLENLVYNEGYIQKKAGRSDSCIEKLCFERNFKNISEVVIKCKDGKELSAEKCILTARLDYFNNMFALRWNQVGLLIILYVTQNRANNLTT